jgi:hypothetical protein
LPLAGLLILGFREIREASLNLQRGMAFHYLQSLNDIDELADHTTVLLENLFDKIASLILNAWSSKLYNKCHEEDSEFETSNYFI